MSGRETEQVARRSTPSLFARLTDRLVERPWTLALASFAVTACLIAPPNPGLF